MEKELENGGLPQKGCYEMQGSYTPQVVGVGYKDRQGNFVKMKGFTSTPDFGCSEECGEIDFNCCGDYGREMVVPFHGDTFDFVFRVPKKIRKKYHSPKRQKEELLKLWHNITCRSFKQVAKTYIIGEIANGEQR